MKDFILEIADATLANKRKPAVALLLPEMKYIIQFFLFRLHSFHQHNKVARTEISDSFRHELSPVQRMVSRGAFGYP